MNNYRTLKHKEWTCEFSKDSFSLTHSGKKLIDSYDGYSELITALSKYLCRKHQLNCPRRNFRIENDQNICSVLISHNESEEFLEFIQKVSLNISKIKNAIQPVWRLKFMQAKKGILSNFSLN